MCVCAVVESLAPPRGVIGWLYLYVVLLGLGICSEDIAGGENGRGGVGSGGLDAG